VKWSQGPVIVVTATKALQEQLIDDDLPHVAAAVRARGGRLTFSLLKGRSNYLCDAKLSALGTADSTLTLAVSNADAARLAAADLVRLQDFASNTITGDRAELEVDVVTAAWEQVSSTSAECPGKSRCPFGDVCRSEAAKTKAASADIVVVNTELYAAHMASEHQVLPDHHVVVVDEAHGLRDAVTGALTEQLSGGRIRRVAAMLKAAGGDVTVADSVVRAATTFDEVTGRAVQDANDAVTVNASDGDLAVVLGSIASDLTALSIGVRPASSTAPDSAAATRAAAVATNLVSSIAVVSAAGSYPDNVAWVEPGTGRMSFAPVDVTSQLSDGLWKPVTVVATSATLAVGERFDDFQLHSGLRRSGRPAVELLVESPFDFSRQGVLYVAKHLPDARQPGFVAAAQNEIGDLVEAAGGRTLALFTSRKAMTEAADALRPRLARAGIEVACQGDTSRARLVERLQASAASGGVAVFATQSFWTGVSVDGAGCSLVIIDKLPFARPTDPLAIARRERVVAAGGDAFRVVDLPRAATLLAQGAGRLIRTTSDRGVVAVLDRRLATAAYRDVLLMSMPPFRRTVDTTAVLATLAELAAAAADANRCTAIV
jgi:ATP-dependent DNA helicase DinG